MNRKLRIPDYLEHIQGAIERIFQYTEHIDEAEFTANTLVQNAVIRNIEIIGEASRNIERADPSFVSRHPEMEFADARAMRNAVSHGYYKVQIDAVWKTVQRDLAYLHEQIVQALASPQFSATRRVSNDDGADSNEGQES